MTCSRVTDGNPARKFVDRLTRFETVKQGLHRDSGPVKHGGATHDFGAARDDRLFHTGILHLACGDAQ